MHNVYIISGDETGKPDYSCRRGAFKCFCVGTITLRNDEAVALFWCMVAQRRNLAWMANTKSRGLISWRVSNQKWSELGAKKSPAASSQAVNDILAHRVRHRVCCLPAFWSNSSDAHPERKGQEPEGSETNPSRRWAHAMNGVRYGMALLWTIWVLLPDDLRNLFVNALSR
jgi:hypothetical protein